MSYHHETRDFSNLIFFGLSAVKTVLILLFTPTLVFAEAEYEETARSMHNRYRTRHDAKALYPSSELHRRAVKCAQYYADMDSIDHTCPFVGDAGENIWAQWGGNPSNNRVATKSISSWYAEEPRYGYHDVQRGTGHFTQMVWKNSRDLGFGIGRARNMVVAVGLYYPAGNVIGNFVSNVKRPLR